MSENRAELKRLQAILNDKQRAESDLGPALPFGWYVEGVDPNKKADAE